MLSPAFLIRDFTNPPSRSAGLSCPVVRNSLEVARSIPCPTTAFTPALPHNAAAVSNTSPFLNTLPSKWSAPIPANVLSSPSPTLAPRFPIHLPGSCIDGSSRLFAVEPITLLRAAYPALPRKPVTPLPSPMVAISAANWTISPATSPAVAELPLTIPDEPSGPIGVSMLKIGFTIAPTSPLVAWKLPTSTPM
jgi:hypothetical protein